MSHTDVVRSWYAALSTGDFDAARKIAHPDIEFNIAPGFPAGGRYAGRDDLFANFYPVSFRAWTTIAVDVDEFLEAGDTVVSLGRYVGTTADGTPFASPFAHVSRIEDGLMRMVHQYVDTHLLQRAIAGEPLDLDGERRWITRVTEGNGTSGG